MSAHTPGPWFAVVRPDGKFDITTNENLELADVLCTRFPWEERCGEMSANAHLMAAAPDLLDALKGVLRIADRATDEFDAARAAIAKAYGAAP